MIQKMRKGGEKEKCLNAEDVSKGLRAVLAASASHCAKSAAR
jgi:hypothetical protein